MTMSPELQHDYDLLQNEVGALRYRLGEYVALFVSSRERIDLLNAVAGVFFRMLSETLWGDMLMHLGRITDPATQGRFVNLSLERLSQTVDASYKPAVMTAVEAAIQAAGFARDGRNKVYAHRDLDTVRDPQGSNITLGSVDQMGEAIAACEAALDTVARCYGANRGTYFHDIRIGIAKDMLRTLEAGHTAQYAEQVTKVQQAFDKTSASKD